MPEYQPFTIQFDDGQDARAITVPPRPQCDKIVKLLGLKVPGPVIFISGGAADMSEDDIAATTQVIEAGLATFAEARHITIIDGGTNAGVMRMMGQARQKYHLSFPLIGVAPRLKVEYPLFPNQRSEARLEAGHSHFVLIDYGGWGHESQAIVDLTRTISGGTYPMLGILINGGKIAEQDIYLATTKGENRIPILVLDGSGRKADELSTAMKTGTTSSKVIRAIVEGGAIDLVSLHGGAAAMLAKLERHFGAVTS